MPRLIVSLDLFCSHFSLLLPLLHLLCVNPLPELLLNKGGCLVFFDELSFRFEFHQELLLGQVVDLPFGGGDRIVFLVKVCYVATSCNGYEFCSLLLGRTTLTLLDEVILFG
jgi:hypothetical protein